MKKILLLIISLSSMAGFSQTENLKLMPWPQEISMGNGQFKIKSEVPTLIFYEFLIIIKPLVVAKWVSKGFGHRTEYYQIPYVAGGCFQTKLALKWVYIAGKKNNFVSLEIFMK